MSKKTDRVLVGKSLWMLQDDGVLGHPSEVKVMCTCLTLEDPKDGCFCIVPQEGVLEFFVTPMYYHKRTCPKCKHEF